MNKVEIYFYEKSRHSRIKNIRAVTVLMFVNKYGKEGEGEIGLRNKFTHTYI